MIQDDREWVVATIDADEDYEFSARVTVPHDAAPGDAWLVARTDGPDVGVFNPDPVLRISDTPPPDQAPATGSAAAAAPAGQAQTEDPGARDASTSGRRIWLIAGAIGVAAVLGTWVLVRRPWLRSTRRS